jgi:hypothetical protein
MQGNNATESMSQARLPRQVYDPSMKTDHPCFATDGWDVEPVGGVTNRKPSEIRTNKISAVPGVDAPVRNLFGLSQVLSWIAGQRLEISEDLEWRSQVHK